MLFIQLVFEGVVGKGFRGDIGLDDIRVTEGVCPHIGSCDFEYDMCGLFNSFGNDKFDWLRNSGETASSYTGPPVDHTTNTDHGKILLQFYNFDRSFTQV